jgi:hypothetical protein
VKTSPGNFQFWFFLKAAVTAELAQKLGERIRHAVNSDHDTGNPTSPIASRERSIIRTPTKSRADASPCGPGSSRSTR